MNIRVSKGERFITLTKREKDLLSDAKTLLIELGRQGEGSADMAADKIGEVQRSLNAPKVMTPTF